MVLVQCLRDKWQWVSLSQMAPSGIPGDLPEVTVALPSMGALLGGPIIPPHSWDQKWIPQE
jgi:hypothetical protein